MARKKSRTISRNPIRLLRGGVRGIFLCFAIAFAVFTWTFLAHRFGDRETKDFIEKNALVAIDFVRESSWAPDEVVFALDGVAALLPFVYGDAVEPGVEIVSAEYALAGTPVSGTNFRLLKNTGYLVGFDDARGVPAWCAYKIFRPKSFETGARPHFEKDMRTRAQIAPADYTNSGFDRGHMAPNQAIGACYGRDGQAETFRMSNIVPQIHEVNAGVWKDLEQRALKRYTRAYGEIWVVCGPIFDTKKPKKFGRGRYKVSVPDAFFLILADREESASGAIRTLAFIVPHKAKLDSNLRKYLVSIDEIERRTGLDFFSELSSETQATLESAPAKTVW